MQWMPQGTCAGKIEVWLLPTGAQTPVYTRQGALKPSGLLWLEPRTPDESQVVLCRLEADTPGAAREAAGNAARRLVGEGVEACCLQLSALPDALLPPALAGFVLGGHRLTQYKSQPGKPLACTASFPDGMCEAEGQQLLKQADDETSGVLLARQLTNLTATDLTPLKFAARMQERFAGTAVQVEVLQGEALVQEGFAGIPAVGRGSRNAPCLIVLRLATKPDAPLTALIGKGVTYDMGGMNVKTGADISDTRFDMGGAAAVAGAFDILQRTGTAANLLGLLPCAENLPDAEALLPGEVLTFMDGTTVQVTNTDAEGRLLLADALLYAQKQGARQLVDLATLTGNVGLALGMDIAAVLGDDGLCAALCAAGANTGDAVWQLPLVQRYTDEMKSSYADIKSTTASRLGGCIKAALFLRHFVEEESCWAHIDMAATAQAETAWGYRPVGPTGFGAALLADFVRELP